MVNVYQLSSFEETLKASAVLLGPTNIIIFRHLRCYAIFSKCTTLEMKY